MKHSTQEKREPLVNLRDVVLVSSLPPEDRICCYLEQIKHPYCFNVDEIPVQISYAQTNRSFQTVIQEMLSLP